jgi:sugar phosphate isomerase/epimerase
MPSLTLTETAAVSRALGIGAIEVSLFYRSGLNKALILSDPSAAAEEIRALEMPVPNYYHLFGEGLSGRNLADPDCLDENLKDFEKVMTFADASNIASVFVLPGIVNPGQCRMAALDASATALREMQAITLDHRAKLCFEPHVQSFAESPDVVRRLVEASGVGIALDYSHFACLGYRQEEVDPLAPHAVHVHLRQAKMGALQAKFAQGTLNFPAMFATLRDAGYDGWLAIEPVHQDYMNTWFDDVLTEIVALRDCFHNWNGGNA